MLAIIFDGDWRLQNNLPAAECILSYLREQPDFQSVVFDSQGIIKWDTGLCTFLLNIIEITKKTGVKIDLAGLPEGVRRLLALATAVASVKDTGRKVQSTGSLNKIGQSVIEMSRGVPEALHFLGETAIAFARFFKGKAKFRHADFYLIIQDVGPRALPIVTLISFLVGLILAYMGAVQLQQFGAQIFIADLVGIGMVREMAALMTGIIMAGRSGAAFAAQLGTMQVNEEIDALKTLGISPMEYLVLPRMLALIMMVPLMRVILLNLGCVRN